MERTVLVACVLIGGGLASQSYTWRTLAGPYPPGRSEHGMVFDSARGELVVFGGRGDAGPGIYAKLDDTWTRTASGWSQAAPASSPAPRADHGFAFDSQRGVAVLFGGDGPTIGPDNETWEWDGSAWTQVLTATVPPGREVPAMVYDSTRGKVVMFGGAGGSGALADTWEFDGSNWTQVATASSPGPRYRHAMSFDVNRGVTVLYGGYGLPGLLDDTWEFDGVVWSQVITPTTPGGREGHAMAYDPGIGATVMTRGNDGAASNPTDTWAYDGVNWVSVATAQSPGHGRGSALTYDAGLGQIVLFGGYRHSLNYGSETLAFDTWPAMVADGLAYGTGCGSPPLTLSTPTNARPIIGQPSEVQVSNSPTPLAGIAVGWSNTFAWPIPLPFDLSHLGMTGCMLQQSNEVFGLPATSGGAGVLAYVENIPFNPYLLGAHVYLQGYAYAPGVNAAEVIVSNGVDWLIGNQ